MVISYGVQCRITFTVQYGIRYTTTDIRSAAKQLVLILNTPPTPIIVPTTRQTAIYRYTPLFHVLFLMFGGILFSDFVSKRTLIFAFIFVAEKLLVALFSKGIIQLPASAFPPASSS